MMKNKKVETHKVDERERRRTQESPRNKVQSEVAWGIEADFRQSSTGENASRWLAAAALA